MRYEVLEPLKHDKIEYGKGGRIDLTKEQAESLLIVGAIKKIEEKKETSKKERKWHIAQKRI